MCFQARLLLLTLVFIIKRFSDVVCEPEKYKLIIHVLFYHITVVLDVGTNNKELLEDPDYIGIRKPRLEGDEYFQLVDEFMAAGAYD